MIHLTLNGTWKMRNCNDSGWIEGSVPGSVFCDLLNAGRIEDPYYRDNEPAAFALTEFDYEYRRSFAVDEKLLACEKILLCCDGLDTLARLYINGQLLAETNDMHRTYEFDVRGVIHSGENEISIVFLSPSNYVRKMDKVKKLISATGQCTPGYPHLRKAHSMFGWDSEPEIPDSGIWRDIAIKGYDSARIDQVYTRQKHEEGRVTVSAEIGLDRWKAEELEIEAVILTPEGRELRGTAAMSGGSKAVIPISIEEPRLWWPNGYGEQPLYGMTVTLKKGMEVLDQERLTIGLRTFKVRMEPDQWGESFEFVVNGVPVFAKGGDYIPLDKFLPACRGKRLEQMIKDCVEANFNCIRVWGGAIFPDDEFFDFCDRYGLIVWEDLMFACSYYDLTDDFIENIKRETEDNVRRLRNHPCLGLWCGNNENEWLYDLWHVERMPNSRADYLKQYEVILADVVRENDPDRLYWPSSPSSGGGFEDPNGEAKGDGHCWDIWHNATKPYTSYTEYFYRFTSEYGLQSLPCMKTIEEFTLPEDRNISSYVMDLHQRNSDHNGNPRIVYYVLETMKYPKDFERLVYASQVVQADATAFGTEHWRRNWGRCMGALYWQINDCWPAPTWAGIDYKGRWKALHYYAKRFFAPVLVSAIEKDNKVEIYVVNDLPREYEGRLTWRVRDNLSKIVREDALDIKIGRLGSKAYVSVASDELVPESLRREQYLEYALEISGSVVSSGTWLFTKPKHFKFVDPRISVDVSETGDAFILKVSAKAFAKSVGLELKHADCRFSDNYFDLAGGAVKEIRILKETISKAMDVEALKEDIRIISVFDI
jgi:beta-mannosidase